MNLDGYVTVNERLAAALEQYPELRIVEEAPEIRSIDGSHYIEVAVTVYRDTDDPLPGIARAWEPWPGKTPFVRDSEMMNCATSALGRALGYMGFGLARSIASADEVQLRKPDSTPQEAPRAPGKPTSGQLRIIAQMAAERGVETEPVNSFEAASAEIARLKEIPRP